jgi:hypothetical protein
MTWVRLQSSHLEAVAQEGDDLMVRFRNGRIYSYRGAGKHLQALIEAESAGSYLHREVRPNHDATWIR